MNFLNYINNFRGIAIVFIVAGHCVDAFRWDDQREAEVILSSIFKNGTLIFVFISGFLFQHLSYKFKYTKYLITKFKNVVLPYIFLSIPAIILILYKPDFYDFRGNTFGGGYPTKIMMFYITGKHITTYWFIPMICIYYLVSPFLVKLSSFKLFFYLLPFYILLSILIPRGGSILYNFIHFFSVYVFGMFCKLHIDSIFAFFSKYRFAGLINAVLIALCFCICIKSSGTIAAISSYIKGMLLCIFFIFIFDKYDHKVRDFGAFLASVSFAIYLLHPYTTKFSQIVFGSFFSPKKNFLQIIISHSLSGNIYSWFTFTIFTIVITSITIEIVKRILGNYSKSLIGS